MEGAAELCRCIDARLDEFREEGSASVLGRFLVGQGVSEPKLRQVRGPAGPVEIVSSASDGQNGAAVVRYPDGSAYVGEIRNGRREGSGVRLHAGAVPLLYVGEYVRGRRQGVGRLLDLSSGSLVYEGQWSRDAKHGEGTLFHDGATYRGGFAGDAFDGQGKLSWANGNVYQGEFRGGKRSGRGVIKFAAGDAYEGEFLDGLFHGEGTYRWPAGEVYVGQFRAGRIQGEGAIQYAQQVRGVGVFGAGEAPDRVSYDLLQP